MSGADGALWFTHQGTTKAIGRVTTDGTITEFALAPPALPRQIRVGPDGEIWFTDVGTPAIDRVLPAGTIVSYALPAGSVPNALTIGADGNLWFTDRGTAPAIWRITTGGTVAPFSTGLNPGSLRTGSRPAPRATSGSPTRARPRRSGG